MAHVIKKILKRKAATLLFMGLLITAAAIAAKSQSEDKMKSPTVYEYKAKSNSGDEISLDKYKGKVLLIVNTASKCGFTKQYEGLEKLYEKYNSRGFEILAFPCNQFGAQEPGSAEEIKQFCSLQYGVKFQIFDKIEVNGDNAHPLYKFLVKSVGGMVTDSIKWNFTKFLIDKEGKPVKRYAPQTTPEKISDEIEKMLG